MTVTKAANAPDRSAGEVSSMSACGTKLVSARSAVMSAFGVKQTSGWQAEGAAIDPKRTLAASAERDLWNTRDHIGLMSANLITLPHFSVSSAISLPKSAGDPGSGGPPRSARRALILASASAALTSLLSLSTISVGVLLGTPTPYHWLVS